MEKTEKKKIMKGRGVENRRMRWRRCKREGIGGEGG